MTHAIAHAAGEQIDDLTFVVRAQEGDAPAFEVLVRRHQGQLNRLAVRLLGNSSDAEDAVQRRSPHCPMKLCNPQRRWWKG
ncbi:MAG: hypothetical protein DLM62_15340 [Pseudonocardiales bacterium]|nr:MAG: hypothetical protein DLM62_15340 [Pseudonocardiales bacterium]